VKVGDWIQNRKDLKEVYQIESIIIDIDETMVFEMQQGGAKFIGLTRALAARPFLRLMAPDGAPYPDGFTQYPADFKVISEEELREVEASWRTVE